MTPKRYEKAIYEDIPIQLQEILEKSLKEKKGLYIHGAVGTGKTHLAYAVKVKCKKARFYNTTDILRRIRADFGRQAYEKENIEEQIIDYEGLVIIDDVGSEKISDWVAETFYHIINQRYNKMYPMIFTSNLPIDKLAERIGDRTTSRIVEMCEIIELKGQDKRLVNCNKTIINL